MNQKFKFLSLAALAVGGMAVAPASAQSNNTAVAPQDLVLTLQNPGGATNSANTYIANLGPTSTVFRDAAAGSFSLINTYTYTTASSSTIQTTNSALNLNNTLNNFGGSGAWANISTIWVGAVNYRGNVVGGLNLLTGDPNLTLYFTKARTTVGTAGSANSFLDNVPNIASVTNTISQITPVKNALEALSGNVPISTAFTAGGGEAVSSGNPVNTSTNVQGSAYGNLNNGVQSHFGAGNLGTDVLGWTGGKTVELALDLYRVQYYNNIAGQYGSGALTETGEFLGTISITSAGDVGYLKANVVPEPSSMALMALAGLGFFARRRPSAQVNA